jgi:hypothetical protein
MYFRIGQGKDYIYEYDGKFIGRKNKDVLNPTKHQQVKYGVETVADIFPKYYILRVGSFKEEKVVDAMDEWMYFLKKSEIKEGFTAKGMTEAKHVLKYENMKKDDQIAYNIHVKKKRIEMGVADTAIDKGKRVGFIEVAKNALKKNFSVEDIMDLTHLSREDVLALLRGEELDKDED